MDIEFYKHKLLSRIENVEDCWIWLGSINQDGYGNIWVDKKPWRTHRLSYFIHKGEIQKGLCVCHKCDKPACINPEHLWLGTHIDNMKDMVTKKRTLYAEQRPNNKIPSWVRPEIVKKYLSGITQLQLAKEYNCHASAIYNAINCIIPDRIKGFRGEKHPKAKLTEKDVLQIRKYFDDGLNKKDIASKYNITQQAVNRIVKRIAWSHI